MKGNKKLLVIAALLLAICVGVGTYAIYRSTATGTATATTASWAVKVNGKDMETSSFTFTGSDINWTTNPSKVAGKIAPGATGTITLEIDATGSEVDVDYTATIGDVKVGNTAVSNSGFTVAVDSESSLSGTIPYAATNMKKTVVLKVTWDGDDNDIPVKDTSDKGMAGKDITIPVTVTAKQHIGG